MKETDVVIVGAGPAACAAATVLARAGVDVVVFERDTFPRFHIGESLLPIANVALESIGFDIGVCNAQDKLGALFIDEAKDEIFRYNFEDGLAGTPTKTHQVVRSAFDAELAKHAERSGATVLFGHRVENLHVDADGVRLEAVHGDTRVAYRARYVLDASGQRSLIARYRKTLLPIDIFGKFAEFFHIEDIDADAIAEYQSDGSIRVLVKDDGWVWLIPLGDQRLSVGIVATSKERLDSIASGSKLVRAFCESGARLPSSRTAGFCYSNVEPFGSRWACIGDASMFLDPVFSSGVSLGLCHGVWLGEALAEKIRAGHEADPSLAKPVQEKMAHGYTCIGSLVSAFYNTQMIRLLFFAERPIPLMRAGLITMLAGDVWRDDNPLQDMLLKSKRRVFSPGQDLSTALRSF